MIFCPRCGFEAEQRHIDEYGFCVDCFIEVTGEHPPEIQDKKLALLGFWPGKQTKQALKTTFLLDKRCDRVSVIDRKLCDRRQNESMREPSR
jgi:hypothetical protein